MPQPLPPGVAQGTYDVRPTAAGTVEIDVREFVGWWETEQAAFVRRVREAAPTLIRLSIASGGGFIADALAIHDFLRDYPARVEVDITGLTASAATVIALAGDRVRMSDNALFLVHHASGGIFAWGKAQRIEEAASYAVRTLRAINARMTGLYRKRTGRTEEEIETLMGEEAWLSAEDARAWGFVDETFEPSSTAAPATALAPAAAPALRAVAYAPPPETLEALGLPPLPPPGDPPNHQPRTALRPPTPMPPEAALPQAPAPAPLPAPAPEASRPAPPPAPSDEAAAIHQRVERLEAENTRLRAQSRAAALEGLRQAWTGRAPAAAVEALAELAEAADTAAAGRTLAFAKPIAAARSGQEVGVIQRLTALAADFPALVTAERLQTADADASVLQARADAVRKM